MTRSEFKQVGMDAFAEVLQKVRTGEAREFLTVFIAELEDRGLDLENDDGDFDESEVEDDE